MRWFVLLTLSGLTGCYAVPSEHEIEPVKPADAGEQPEPDGEVENGDAATDPDAGGDERDADAAPMDAKVDAGGSLDATQDASPSEDASPDAEASVCGKCEGATPECNVNTTACVACLADDAGACQGKLCSNANACIECRTNTDCKNPAASVCDVGSGTCVGCTDGNDGQCAHIQGKGVCSAGSCVQCRRDKADACSMAGAQYVCDATTHACDFQRKLHSKTLCNACVSAADTGCKAKLDCVSDDECQTGQACVDVPAGGGKKVCQQFVSGSPCPAPYTKLTDSAAASADGPAVKVCTFAVATTCMAHAHYRVKRCGTPSASNPDQDVPGTGLDSKCGEENIADGYCVYSEAFKQHLCTVPCNANNNDCPNQVVCDTLPTPDRCTL
ncbi:MAG TPA: hypothetical protein VFZ61_18650 [Polyangiales bacterium]